MMVKYEWGYGLKNKKGGLKKEADGSVNLPAMRHRPHED